MSRANGIAQQRFRETLKDSLLYRVLHERATNPALFLSGGVDSASALFALLDLGYKPVCYTFYLDGPSLSTDAQVARSMCDHFKIEHQLVKIARDWDVAMRDTALVIDAIKTTQKTHVQCTIPMAYVAAQMRKDGFTKGIMAMAIGDAWATSRHPQMLYHKEGELASRIDRYNHVHDPNLSDYSIIRGVGKLTDLYLVDCTRDDDFLNVMLSLSMVEMHKPLQKQVALDAFKDYWAQGAWYRQNSSMQINSGLRDFYDTLLNSPYNRTGAGAIVGLYNAIKRDLDNGRIIDDDPQTGLRAAIAGIDPTN